MIFFVYHVKICSWANILLLLSVVIMTCMCPLEMCYWILNVGTKHLLDVWSVLPPPDMSSGMGEGSQLSNIPWILIRAFKANIPCSLPLKCLSHCCCSSHFPSGAKGDSALLGLLSQQVSLLTWGSLFPNSFTYKWWLPSNEIETRIKKWVCRQGMAESANGVFWYFYFSRFLVRKSISEDSFCHC